MRIVIRAAAFTVAVAYLRRGVKPVLAGYEVGVRVGRLAERHRASRRWRSIMPAGVNRAPSTGT